MPAKKQISKKVVTLEKIFSKLEEHNEKLINHDGQLERIIINQVKHEERLDSIDEKLKKLDRFDEVLAGQDKMISILDRVDQERVFTNEAIKRLEKDVARIKLHLHLA